MKFSRLNLSNYSPILDAPLPDQVRERGVGMGEQLITP